MKKHVIVVVFAFLLVLIVGLIAYLNTIRSGEPLGPLTPEASGDGIPVNVTLSGTFVCLPHIDSSSPQSKECAFGFQTDDGIYYSVNFGQSAEAMQRFQNREHISAEGYIVSKEALNTDQWSRYNMQGVFTITRVLESSGSAQKLDITAVCQGALAYMTFADGTAADLFVTECIAGKHPEVIERYKQSVGNEVSI